MAQFSVKSNLARIQADEEQQLIRELERLEDSLQSVSNNLRFKVAAKSNIRSRLNNSTKRIGAHARGMSSMHSALVEVLDDYERTERRIVGDARVEKKEKSTANSETVLETFVEEFQENYGWKEILKGAGHIGIIYNLINDAKNVKSWDDLKDIVKDTCEFIDKAGDTYRRYKKIGNAVGTKKAMTWWAKNITGLKSLGRVSEAKNPFIRFRNNLTNKTSPFNAQIKDTIGDFSGKNGTSKAVAKWGGVLLDGVMNWFSNKDEQAASGGEMSDGRVWAETITETAVGTVLSHGASIVAGAAVSALLPVAAPGVLVVAASGALVAAANAGVKALTGQTATEWISDGILNAGEAIGSKISDVAKNVSKSMGRWFGKLGFA